jgi:hypothetical protein
VISSLGYNSYPFQIQQNNLDRLNYTDQIGLTMMANDGQFPPGGLGAIHQQDKTFALDTLLGHLLGLGQQTRLNSSQQQTNRWANTFTYPMSFTG